MAITVTSAFNEFQKNIVNLDPEITATARSSRNWLLDQISKFPENNNSFPILYPEINVGFGSFARKTKTRPLDDIDLMIGINANGCTYYERSWDNIELNFPENYSGRLKNYAKILDSSTLSSTRITNAFKSELSKISQYSSAEIKRDGEATTLKLKSYTWNFDIVPCFLTAPDYYGNSYYLIPNRIGNWKKTNPKIDRDRLIKVNQKQAGRVLNIIRILKYWKQEKKVNIGSYLLEAMILYYYENLPDNYCSEYVDLELENIFTYLAYKILSTVADPKGIQTDINDIDYFGRHSLHNTFLKFSQLSNRARQFENNGNMKDSIQEWKKVFGESFPDYG
ncbi:nucleotidyltransferase [Acinetobacter baumannii]|uniref:nucleotidyltransferase n=1 Tax=Acinetobacter baumannii TaxID=470 RepID=UPI002341CBFB|nr:nucleotidyltransferase [Acinetobacter baumannii]MDC5475267.1 nucleotidyltransferase [Acinetobacter baumannii]MDH2491395.1 nucleotidyltransferase [Acinetobacter baumannii]